MSRILTSATLFFVLICVVDVYGQQSEQDLLSIGTLRAEFRGCSREGWCRFAIESLTTTAQLTHQVYPDGVARAPSESVIAIEVRDRMNAMLASMVHQHKRIVLHDFRKREDGGYAARVSVNEADLASDPVLRDLLGKLSNAP